MSQAPSLPSLAGQLALLLSAVLGRSPLCRQAHVPYPQCLIDFRGGQEDQCLKSSLGTERQQIAGSKCKALSYRPAVGMPQSGLRAGWQLLKIANFSPPPNLHPLLLRKEFQLQIYLCLNASPLSCHDILPPFFSEPCPSPIIYYQSLKAAMIPHPSIPFLLSLFFLLPVQGSLPFLLEILFHPFPETDKTDGRSKSGCPTPVCALRPPP